MHRINISRLTIDKREMADKEEENIRETKHKRRVMNIHVYRLQGHK